MDSRRIVVAVDGSPASDDAVLWAAAECRLRGDAPVTLVHVITPAVGNWPVEALVMNEEWYEEDALKILDHSRKLLEAALGEQSSAATVQTEVLRDNVVGALSDCSREAQLVVLGSRGLGSIARRLLGSVSSGLIHHAQCPVVVVHHYTEKPDAAAPIMVGVEGSPTSDAAVAFAFDAASRRGVDVVAVHAWTDVGAFPAFMDWDLVEVQAHEILAERLAGYQEQYPDVHVVRRVLCDRPAHWLVEGSKQVQLVVVGSRGRGGFAGLRLGSVASAVAQQSFAPVAVVPPTSAR